jgi:LmbE family N-acetylglucosaminyl deacetylase
VSTVLVVAARAARGAVAAVAVVVVVVVVVAARPTQRTVATTVVAARMRVDLLASTRTTYFRLGSARLRSASLGSARFTSYPSDVMSPTVVHVAPHPDDEAVGCPGALLHLRDRGWRIVSVIASLGFPDQWDRRRAEAEEASRRAGFTPVFLDPPLNISLDDDLALATDRLSSELPGIVSEYDASIVASPSPHDVHHGHEVVGRGVQRALAALPDHVRWWMWGVWGDLPAPNVFYPFADREMSAMLHILEAYAGELERNDFRRLLTGRATANAVLGSERVFGFGSPAASTLPYAEVLTEVRLVDGRFMASGAHQLDEGSSEAAVTVDLTAWVESPTAHELIGPIREVHQEGT